jgi:hypothetical protein
MISGEKDDPDNDRFYLDFTCSWSMIGDKSLLIDVVKARDTVCGGNNNAVNNVIGIGVMPVMMINAQGVEATFDIPNVRLIENFNAALIRPQELKEVFGFDTDVLNKKAILNGDGYELCGIKEDDANLPYIYGCVSILNTK